MKTRYLNNILALSIILLFCFSIGNTQSGNYNRTAPSSTVKLIFIHHSCGENWLSDSEGRLGIALRDNNYFVSDTNYGWGPNSIGDNTDIGHWWTWFCGSNSSTYLNALYNESSRSWEFYSRLPNNPGGENEIIMFKSCYPNSYLGGNPNDPAATGNNPLRGQDCGSSYHTVANAKGIYNDLLTYFATRQDKLFIAITAPPQVANETDSRHAANARAFNNWLVNHWLENYPYRNVAVFDFYNVLTSNGGNSNTNDAGWESGNHHRWWKGEVQHIQTRDSNTAAYASGDWDSHPTAAGNRKATQEFIDLLNIYYHCWKGSGACPGGDVSNQRPVIDSFTAAPLTGSIPLAVAFTCVAHDPDGSIREYRWDFNGDGSIEQTTSSGTASYTYTVQGTYHADCIVVDNGGAMTASNSLTITVSFKKGIIIRKIEQP
jgi:PKD repeat protein